MLVLNLEFLALPTASPANPEQDVLCHTDVVLEHCVLVLFIVCSNVYTYMCVCTRVNL